MRCTTACRRTGSGNAMLRLMLILIFGPPLVAFTLNLWVAVVEEDLVGPFLLILLALGAFALLF